MKRVVLLTGSEYRHRFFRKALSVADSTEVLRSYCEGPEHGLNATLPEAEEGADLQRAHLDARARSEHDFFSPFVSLVPDKSNPLQIPKGEINAAGHFEEIRRLEPDLILAYGCSIIRDPLLTPYLGRILNVHLGLSPYYRGAGTNFWPLVNGEPEYVGATFMYMDKGVDTGEIIHQIRARVYPEDTPHQIGNRLISDMVGVFIRIVSSFEQLSRLQSHPFTGKGKLYRQKDFTPDSVRRLYESFGAGMVHKYLENQEDRNSKVPLLRNPALALPEVNPGKRAP